VSHGHVQTVPADVLGQRVYDGLSGPPDGKAKL
jgi:hypothetical protein